MSWLPTIKLCDEPRERHATLGEALMIIPVLLVVIPLALFTREWRIVKDRK